ncbi:hypothetical protein Are01nite_14800 [Actinoplanes regularis]|nr:hypothetical protein Are01nite_14800 [Actinoplanes regularis]
MPSVVWHGDTSKLFTSSGGMVGVFDTFVFEGLGVGDDVVSSGVGESSGVGSSDGDDGDDGAVTATGALPSALSSPRPPRPQPATTTSTAAAAINRTLIDQVLPRTDTGEER